MRERLVKCPKCQTEFISIVATGFNKVKCANPNCLKIFEVFVKDNEATLEYSIREEDELNATGILSIQIREEFFDLKKDGLEKIDKTDIYGLIAKYVQMHDYVWVGDAKGFFARYFKGVYRKNIESELNALIRIYFKILMVKVKIADINEVKSIIKDLYKLPEQLFDSNPHFINFKNGLFNLVTWELEDHTSEVKTFVQIPHNYNPKAEAPKFNEFLETMITDAEDPEWMKNILLEYMGYCLIPSNKYGKALILCSKEGSTLKTPYISILVHAIGEDSCTSVPLYQLGNPDDKFSRAALIDKLLCFYNDLPQDTIKSRGYVNTLISDPWMHFERKGVNPSMQKNKIRFIFSTQKLPYVKNLDKPFCKRWIIVDCNHKLPTKPEVGDLKDDHITPYTEEEVNAWKPPINPRTGKMEQVIKGWEFDNIINKEEEMEGVIKMAVNALKNLTDRNFFIGANEVSVYERWLMETDIIYRFVKKCCIEGPEFMQKQSDLFEKFLDYCDFEGEMWNGKQASFTKGLRNMGHFVRQQHIFDHDIGKKVHIKAYMGIEFLKWPAEIRSELKEEVEKDDNVIEKKFGLKKGELDKIMEEFGGD